MNSVDSGKIFFSYIRQIDKDKILIDDIIKYYNEVKNRLLSKNIVLKEISITDINFFINYYASYLEKEGPYIIIKDLDKLHHLIEKFELDYVNPDIKQYLVKSEEFIFPIVVNNKFALYSFSTIDKLLLELKELLYKDNDKYLIDLAKIKDDVLENNMQMSIYRIILNDSKLELKVLDYDKLLSHINALELLISDNNQDITNYFKSNTQDLKIDYYRMMSYCKAGNSNSENISKNSTFYKKVNNKFK